ncbi:MAG: GNAT family N-acetyltransferase [Thermoplasmata archaeon]|nr:GNAT family N-acetyltransferase [Thermoplasmata archaeon]
MRLSLRRVEPDSEDYTFAVDLYYSSFPEPERDKIESIMKVSGTDLGEFSVILDGDDRVGILYRIFRHNLVYIYYLAIVPGLRNRGYGTAVLSMIKEMHPGSRFALNTEALDPRADNNDQRLSRIRFYERNGFNDSGDRVKWEGVTYALMSCGGNVSKAELEWMFILLSIKGKRED